MEVNSVSVARIMHKLQYLGSDLKDALQHHSMYNISTYIPNSLYDEVHKVNERSREEEILICVRVSLCEIDSGQTNHLADPMLSQELYLGYQTHLTYESLIPYQYLEINNGVL